MDSQMPCSWKFYPLTFFLSCVKDCIVDMATFTALAKISSLKNYYNAKIAGLGKTLSHEDFQLYYGACRLWHNYCVSCAYIHIVCIVKRATFVNFLSHIIYQKYLSRVWGDKRKVCALAMTYCWVSIALYPLARSSPRAAGTARGTELTVQGHDL